MREIHQLVFVLLHFLAGFVVRSGLFTNTVNTISARDVTFARARERHINICTCEAQPECSGRRNAPSTGSSRRCRRALPPAACPRRITVPRRLLPRPASSRRLLCAC